MTNKPRTNAGVCRGGGRMDCISSALGLLARWR
jgi:hypothetical protein